MAAFFGLFLASTYHSLLECKNWGATSLKGVLSGADKHH
jgi:hypothetical protein